MNWNLLTSTANMLGQAIGRNQTPVVFVMNGRTARAIRETVREVQNPRRGILGWLDALRVMREPLTAMRLHGLPVEQHDKLEDGHIALGVKYPDPEKMLAKMEKDAEELRPVASPEADGVPTLAELSTSNTGKLSAGDVLMKAFEASEDLRGVVVLRVHNDNTVDICMSVNALEAQCVLNKGQYWLAMQNGGR